MGCGNGILMFLMKPLCDESVHFTGLEIQDRAAALAMRNAADNCVSDSVRIVHGDLKEAAAIFGRDRFSAVVTNPPYRKAGSGRVNPSDEKALARHEILCTLEDVIRSSSQVLKSRGRLYMIHQSERLTEITALLTKYHMEAKNIRFIHRRAAEASSFVLLTAVKGGRPGVRIEAPLVVYQEDGSYTDEVGEYYRVRG